MKRRECLKLLCISPIVPSVLMAKEVVPFIDPQPYLIDEWHWHGIGYMVPEDYTKGGFSWVQCELVNGQMQRTVK
ncbi:MAG: hypothetical protein MUO31_06835 [Thermodesulfovibrionales bacterium]|nr:hypothetical protein [Thermodesulfovibrionales bacterium]